MKIIFANNNSYVKIGSFSLLIFLELIPLAFLGMGLFKISLEVISFFFLVFFIYWFFNYPYKLLQWFLFTILISGIDAFNIGEKPSVITLVDIFLPILLVIFLLKVLLDENEIYRGKHVEIKILFALFFLWTFFVAVSSINKQVSIAYWRNYFSGFMMFVFTLFILNRTNKVKSLIITLILWGLTLAVIEFYVLYSLGGVNIGLVRLFFRKNLLEVAWGKSNYLAAFFVLLIPITIGFIFMLKTTLKRLLFLGVLFLMSAAIMLTFSRGGILSLTVALFIFLSRAVKRRTFIPLLLMVIVVAIVVILNPMTRIIFEGISNVENSFSYMSRVNFYKDVWKTFLENPITGVGFGNLGFYSQFKLTDAAASAHNIVLGLLGENGVIGAILFLSILGYSLFLAIKNYINEKNVKLKILLWSFVSAFLGVIVHSMIEPNIEGWQFSMVFWTSVAMFLHFGDLREEERASILGDVSET
ncbi:MAG: O-antigen ligase family protein [Bacteroidetes bacterium]|nr:O-antigen ligase family protein [Bacteroidota bacterium]